MEKIGIVGAGTMGRGIAQFLAGAGSKVILQDIKTQYVEDALESIEMNLNRSVEKERITPDKKQKTLNNIEITTDLKDLRDRELVIEAATEEMEVKKKIFQDLDTICEDDTILATNTSALSITEIATTVANPERVLGIHFFNPVPVMKLVEIVRGLTTSEEIIQECQDFVAAAGKTVVEVQESPGFIVNRILIPMINEAVFLLQEGVASVEDIDTAMKNGANHPTGPLALADMIGIDVCLAIMETLQEELGDDKYRPCPLLRQKVRANQLGRKSGQGFYSYS